MEVSLTHPSIYCFIAAIHLLLIMQHVPPFFPQSLHFLWSLSFSCPCVLHASLLISTVATLAFITALPFTLTKAPCLSAPPTHKEPCPGKIGGALGSSESYSLMNTGLLQLRGEGTERQKLSPCIPYVVEGPRSWTEQLCESCAIWMKWSWFNDEAFLSLVGLCCSKGGSTHRLCRSF